MATPATLPVFQDIRVLARRTWWVFLIGGLASVVFGVIAFARPGLGLFVAGDPSSRQAYWSTACPPSSAPCSTVEKDGWWLLLLLGLLSALVGAYSVGQHAPEHAGLHYVVAFQALAAGIFLVAFGWKIRQLTSREWILYLTGALSILFGCRSSSHRSRGRCRSSCSSPHGPSSRASCESCSRCASATWLRAHGPDRRSPSPSPPPSPPLPPLPPPPPSPLSSPLSLPLLPSLPPSLLFPPPSPPPPLSPLPSLSPPPSLPSPSPLLLPSPLPLPPFPYFPFPSLSPPPSSSSSFLSSSSSPFLPLSTPCPLLSLSLPTDAPDRPRSPPPPPSPPLPPPPCLSTPLSPAPPSPPPHLPSTGSSS